MSLKNLSQETAPHPWNKALFFSVGLLAILMIVKVFVLSLPSINVVLQRWPVYFTPFWAHQTSLVRLLVEFSLMVWLSASALFFGVWLLNRSVRKLRGKPWSLENEHSKLRLFFPPMMLYLRISCVFLMVTILFVILQYPLQFIL